MNLTRAEAAALLARRQRPEIRREPGELLCVWIPGKLDSRLNGSQGRTLKGAKWRAKKQKDARERAEMELLLAYLRAPYERTGSAKAIRFIAHVGHEWDEDNLKASLKPYRDALKTDGTIDDDRPSAGHIFTYEQVIDRKRDGLRGVEIHVRLRGEP